MMIKSAINWFNEHECGMSKDLVCKKEEIKCNNIIKQCKNV